MAVHYPYAMVGLALRFWEPQKASSLVTPTVTGTPVPRASATPAGAPLPYSRTDRRPQLTSAALASQVNAISGSWMPDETDTESGSEYSQRIYLHPLGVEWNANTHREADTAKVTLLYKDFPVDPRFIRDINVIIYAGDLAWTPGTKYSPNQLKYDPRFQAEMQQELLRTGENPRLNPYIRFMGTLSQMSFTQSEEGRALTLEFRDYTAMLIDVKVPTDVLQRLNTGLKLKAAVKLILESLPSTATLEVVSEVGDELDTNQPSLSDMSLRHVLGTDGKTRKGVPAASGVQVTYWDLITDLCTCNGVVPVIYLDRLHLMSPRTLFRQGVSSLPALIWGKNISRMSVSQKFGRTTTQNVRVVCFDPSEKEAPYADYPPIPTKKSTVSGKGQQANYIVQVVKGVQKKYLPAIAQLLWFEYNRQKVEVELTTSSMETLTEQGELRDLMALVARDSVIVESGILGETDANEPDWFHFGSGETISDDQVEGLRHQAFVRALERDGIAPVVAELVSRIILEQGDKLTRVFRVMEANHSIGPEGYKLNLSLATYTQVDTQFADETVPVPVSPPAVNEGRPMPKAQTVVSTQPSRPAPVTKQPLGKLGPREMSDRLAKLQSAEAADSIEDTLLEMEAQGDIWVDEQTNEVINLWDRSPSGSSSGGFSGSSGDW